MSLELDKSRQWVSSNNPVSKHHLFRYVFAAEHAKGRTLDAACGTGYGSAVLHFVTNNVVSVDRSGAAISWGMKNFPGPQYVMGDIEKKPWTGDFDTVVSLETIEHLRNPDAALKAFRESCKGNFIASVPNEVLYPFKAENFVNDESPHYRHYTPEQFDEILEKHGFKVVSRHCQKTKDECEVVDGVDGRFLIYLCV